MPLTFGMQPHILSWYVTELAHLPVYIGGTFNSFHIRHAGKGNSKIYNVCIRLPRHNIIVRTLRQESRHAWFFSVFICTDSEFTSFFCNVFFQVKMQTRCLKDLQGIWRFPSEFAYDLLGQLFTVLRYKSTKSWMRVACDTQLRCMHVTRTSFKQKVIQLHAKVVGLRVFACANSSTAMRIPDKPCSYTNHYRLNYWSILNQVSLYWVYRCSIWVK